MSNCKYCGEPAGFLSNKHKECHEKYKDGINEIKTMVISTFKSDSDGSSLYEALKSIAINKYIKEEELKSIMLDGWRSSVEDAFEDGILTQEEEQKLLTIADHLGFTQELMNKEPAYIKTIKGAVLRDVLEGKIPERCKATGDIPFNLQKNEKIVWLFPDVKYCEMRTRRAYTGGYQGFSVRVMKGLYYRAGAFRGNPVETTQTVEVDKGLLAATNMHLYFSGPNKSFRVKYDKIVAFNPYSDGLGIQRDAQTAKPQIFVTGDGWFTSNLIMNLAKL